MDGVIALLVCLVLLTFIYLGAIRLEAEDFDQVRLDKVDIAFFATYMESHSIIRFFLDWPLVFIVCLTIFHDLPHGSRSRHLCQRYILGFLVLAAEIIVVSGLIYLEYGRP